MKKFNDKYYTGKRMSRKDRTFIWDMRLLSGEQELRDDKFIQYYWGIYYYTDKCMEQFSDYRCMRGEYGELDSHMKSIFYRGIDREFMNYLNKHPNRDKYLKKYFNKPVKEIVEYIELKTANWKL